MAFQEALMAHSIRNAIPRVALAAVMVLAGISSLTTTAAAQSRDMEPAVDAVSSAMDRSGDLSPPAIVGTAVTYQGRLLTSGSPSDGLYDFEFRLYDAAAGGLQIGGLNFVDNAAVSDGRFTVNLDFGQSAFGGGARWLDIRVRPGAGGAYTQLTPRQKLNAAPYALGMPNVYTNETSSYVGVGRDAPVTGADEFGVNSTTVANQYGGMYVNTSDAGGWPFYGFATGGVARAWTWYNGTTSEWKLYNGGERLTISSGGGLEILSTTTTDGLRINDTADDGVQIGNGTDFPNFGVYIPSPGVSSYGLWSNTSAANGNYGLYTPDNIEAGIVTMAAQFIVAQVAGVDALSAGDVASAAGVADPLDGGTNRLAVVQLAGRDGAGIVGVVATRMEWQAAPGKEAEGEMVLMPADGPARDGDYVALVVQGVTDVRVQRGASIAKGERLTVADTGGVRKLRVETLNGMAVSEGTPVVGVALENSSGRDTVPVFVNVH
jgi:hypothetical protein